LIAHFAAVLAPRSIAPEDDAMVLAYHCIFGMYGFWLRNDPREPAPGVPTALWQALDRWYSSRELEHACSIT
jgi:hypothetical protein